MYTVTHGTFRTPRGRSVTMAYREDTNDWNTLRSCLDEDEYRLGELDLTGTALDIGAHIGGVTVALLMDNPDLRVIAVEAVPPNVELLRQNLERNGLAERVTVLHAAAGKGKRAIVRWAFSGNEAADHHTFIGNAVMPATTLVAQQETEIPVVTLPGLVREYGPIGFVKIDCEGCEYDVLRAIPRCIGRIRGEAHRGPLHLSEYDVTYTAPGNEPRGFEAVRRG